ncbi:MAG: EAL domain-containing protein, partial [Hyphomicrobiales bacterium]|nr:EAL domain-containing protein [Hyphomicrobiales bacterium]
MRTRVSAIVDLTERKAAEERIRHVALHDPLTGLANRALFNERVNALIEESKTGGFSCAIVLVDLDRFKDVNDLHGHAAGDTVIKTAADRLRDLISHTDFVARLGGDEFAVLQANIQFRSQTADLSRRIVEALGEPIPIDNGLVVSCGASVGAALCPDDGSDDTTLMVRADTALYNAKNNGRNLFALFEEGMDAELRRRKRLENDLSSAIERNEFELYFQPRVSVKQRKVGGYEALVRWQHPEKGLISPGDFVPVAEQSGKIVQIGEWVLREACRIAVEKFDDERVSVNVSPIQFRDGELINIVRETLETAGLPPDRLEVEITENVLIDDDQRAISMLRELKELGVRVTLDDFGTGYSSLGYLSRFPFDTIKIDRSFVTGLRTDQSTRSIIETIIKLARALDMDVVGEGVEEIEDLKFLTARGCDELQGYLIGRPAPADQVVRHVADHLLRAVIEGQAESAADMMRSTANAMNSVLPKQSGTPTPVRRKKRA